LALVVEVAAGVLTYVMTLALCAPADVRELASTLGVV